MNEEISQLIDNELDPHQRKALLERISKDDAARKSWKCYHLIGDVIRHDVSSTGNDLAASIRNNLEKEPTVLAPLSVKASSSTAKTNIWKPVGIFSVAASLVLVAVMTLSPLGTRNEEGNLGNNGGIANISSAEQLHREFHEMLINHAEFTTSSGMSGLIVYARLISAEQLEQ